MLNTVLTVIWAACNFCMKHLLLFKKANIILIRNFYMKFHWRNFAAVRISLILVHRTETLSFVKLFDVQSANITVEAEKLERSKQIWVILQGFRTFTKRVSDWSVCWVGCTASCDRSLRWLVWTASCSKVAVMQVTRWLFEMFTFGRS